MIDQDKLVDICRRYTVPIDTPVVIFEPYVPFIPENWNKCLVLAESQNLSNTNAKYVIYLKGFAHKEKYFRLNDSENLGIQPWDDGSLKLAVQSAFHINATETAVSNSVVWSQVTSTGNNISPSKHLINLSSTFWSEILSEIKPDHIITSGNIAHEVIGSIEQGPWQHTRLRLPSPNAMSRVSGMFPENDLLSRYQEVEETVNRYPEWLNGGYRQNKIFFACHAVSVVKSKR